MRCSECKDVRLMIRRSSKHPASIHRGDKEAKRIGAMSREDGDPFETLLTHVPLGAFIVDADFNIRLVNSIALPVFGDIPNLIGRDFSEVMHRLWTKTHADDVAANFRNTLETGASYQI